jgi:hypothetical protein
VKRPHREPPEAGVLLDAVRDARCPADEWAFFSEVRNTTGAAGDVLRFADAIGVKLTPAEGWHVEGFEVKRDTGDLDDELRHPEKSAPFRLFCRKWWLIVPWLLRDAVIARLARIPEAWGVLVVDRHGVEVLREATDRKEAERPSDGFVKSLLRASRREAVGDGPGVVAGVPTVRVARTISRTQVEGECGHIIDRPPLAKVRTKRGERPPPVPCVRCGQEQRLAAPPAVLARIAVAPADELRVYEQAIRERVSAETKGAA